MKKRMICLALVLLSLLAVLAGCGSGAADSAAPMMMPRPPASNDTMRTEMALSVGYGGTTVYERWDMNESIPMPLSEPESAPADSLRKIIFNYDYQLETKDMQATLNAIEAAVAASGGFVSYSNQSGRDDEGQFWYAQMTLRIPTRNAVFFEHAVEHAGHVRSKNSSGRDVTDEYFDIEARLRTLTTQETRLLELLRQSGDLSDLLQIERELTRVRTDIERLTGSLRRYDDLIDLATFTLYVHSVREFTPPTTTSFGTRLWQSVTGSLRGSLRFFQNSLIVLVYVLPYALAAGVIALIVFKVFFRKRRDRKNAAKNTPGDQE